VTKATVVLCLLLPAACSVDIAFKPTNPPPHPLVARAPSTVEIHRLAPNDRPFVEVGVLDEAEAGAWVSGTEDADNLLRQKAAEIGCDALVIQGFVQRGGPYRAICIVYKN
jgi:hypothetical protein